MIGISNLRIMDMITTARAALRPRTIALRHIVLALLMSLPSVSAQAQTGGTVSCIIASNDGRNGFRTDEISNCRVNTSDGTASFVMNQKNRTRSYSAVEPLTTQHLAAAASLLNRVGQLRFPARTNPAGFDPQDFLKEASQATHGFVLVRTKNKGGRALNVVYITDGVYRSIDFPGTNLNEIPAGFLTTRR